MHTVTHPVARGRRMTLTNSRHNDLRLPLTLHASGPGHAAARLHQHC
jgi:hypothetical protein